MVLRWLTVGLVVGLALASTLQADLKRALAERNLEKRSQYALENAMSAYQAARKAYEQGDNERVAAAATEIVESVDLAYTSLEQTGKDPRRSPKWFKRAEITTRDLHRKLESFQHDMSFADRPLLDKVKARVQHVHDELLLGLMEGKRK
jgi:hypothetical protein